MEDKEKEKEVDDGWGPLPDITLDPIDVWGKKMDDRDPLGSTSIALVTQWPFSLCL